MSMIFLLCLLAFCNAQEIYLFNGKAADSCVNSDVLPRIASRDCITTEVPEPSNTVLLPAASSVAPVVTAGSTLTITGQSLEQLPSFGAGFVVGLARPNSACSTGFDPSLATAVVACSTATVTCSSIQFSLPASWITSAMELETKPRYLCFGTAAPATTYFTGFKIGTVWDCNDAVAATSCANLPKDTSATARTQAIRTARTVCCRHTRMGAANVAAANAQFAVGQCVNPNVTACCQGALVEPARMRCCNADYETVQWLDSPCPCRSNNPICPGTQQCCSATKYPELINADAIWPQQPGQCFDPATQLCCNTGFAYNPGVQQCCSINGVQSASVPCPCGRDSDCQGGQTTSKDAFGVENGMFCCAQDQPMGTEISTCSAYTNFPTGTAPYQVQRCPGVCIDNRFQICCNGLVCHKEYEKCCNSSCCNKRIGTCMEAQRAQAPGFKRNPLEFGIRYEVCSTIEQMDPLRAYWIFVLPTFLLASTFLGVAVVVAFINHSTRRSYSFIERTMIVLAALTTIFALPAYFAPIYKYGVWVCFTCIFTMVAAAARVRWLNAAAVILNFVLLMYLFDPFNGNRYFNFASLRVTNGDADAESGGLLAATGKSWRSLDSVKTAKYCTQWYDYFAIDFQMVDERWYNTDRVTFGYCSRGWVTALLIFEGLVLLLTLVQFVLAFIALILRFAEERSLDPIELQVHGAQEVPLMMYGY